MFSVCTVDQTSLPEGGCCFVEERGHRGRRREQGLDGDGNRGLKLSAANGAPALVVIHDRGECDRRPIPQLVDEMLHIVNRWSRVICMSGSAQHTAGDGPRMVIILQKNGFRKHVMSLFAWETVYRDIG